MWFFIFMFIRIVLYCSKSYYETYFKGKKGCVGFFILFQFHWGNRESSFFYCSAENSPNGMVVGAACSRVCIYRYTKLSAFSSARYLEASIQGTVFKFRLVWTFVFSVLILNEAFTINKIIGIVLTLISGWLITFHFGKKKTSLFGIILAFSSTILYAIVVICYKYLFSEFNSQSLTFFIFLLPAVINIIAMPNALRKIKDLFMKHTHWLIGACVFGSIANLFMNYALSIGEVSRVVVIIEAFLIATLVGESVWLKERDQLYVKIGAALMVIAGAYFMKI